ncbi:hypothetical protein XS13_001602 [Salmonella enterica subsp. enterica]|nr:hypothetical protein [Salmonella enterica subsp. enterica]
MYLEAIDVTGVVPRGFPLVGRIGCPEITSAASTTEHPQMLAHNGDGDSPP